MIVGMMLVVMLTTGRTVGAEQRVLGSIDDVGTRTIEVDAQADAGLTSDVLDRIARIGGIQWSGAFSAPVDATNSAIPDGTLVPVRLAYGRSLGAVGVPLHSSDPGHLAYGSRLALQQLGLPDVAGSITTTDGNIYGIGGVIATPAFLRGLEPVVVVPQTNTVGTENVSILVVVAKRPDLVKPVSQAILSVLAVQDVSKISVQTSEQLAQLRAVVRSQLGTFSRGLVAVLLAVTGLLVAVILYGLVMMRRKDFGRRRALGATRALITALLITQTCLLALIGVTVGTLASVIVLAATGDPLPNLAFVGALAVLTVATALLAALLPASVAARREPIRELRVP
jgi:putative ABC transport system permease protein